VTALKKPFHREGHEEREEIHEDFKGMSEKP
jgi:hypothetical protein